jgi:hypothetical protein
MVLANGNREASRSLATFLTLPATRSAMPCPLRRTRAFGFRAGTRGVTRRSQRPAIGTGTNWLFSFISVNWHGRPLRSHETSVSLVDNTTNRGVSSSEPLDLGRYSIGKKLSAKEFRALRRASRH